MIREVLSEGDLPVTDAELLDFARSSGSGGETLARAVPFAVREVEQFCGQNIVQRSVKLVFELEQLGCTAEKDLKLETVTNLKVSHNGIDWVDPEEFAWNPLTKTISVRHAEDFSWVDVRGSEPWITGPEIYGAVIQTAAAWYLDRDKYKGMPEAAQNACSNHVRIPC